MGRIVIELALLFVVPFAAFAAYEAFRQRDPKAAIRFENGPARYLALIGMALMVGALLLFAFRQEPHTGPYRPAEFKDGVLVPGTVR